ncbi:copper homeostasis CutC domain-containing protein [Bombardia bombarda]|uniref:Copper homeostasis protein cutC homolog n=1 Tax=Bombardia bombarda TaxID=252184 RepID=A0AA39WI57_9PEZI|nr:copper homeostasis CutC domain-containing protein [Bombardia bombarda]
MSSRSVPPGIGLEVPVFGSASALEAIKAGARRLEVNHGGSYVAGGITPNHFEVRSVRGVVDTHYLEATTTDPIPIRVMIRPRGPPRSSAAPSAAQEQQQDFIYSDAEFAAMRSDINIFKNSRLVLPERGDGFVFGILEKKTARTTASTTSATAVQVDIARNTELVNLAKPLRCVFHRAFDDLIANTTDDDTKTIEDALATVYMCGFDGILTSGGRGNVSELKNVPRLGRIVAGAITVAGAAVSLEGVGSSSSSNSKGSSSSSSSSLPTPPTRAMEIIIGGGVRSGYIDLLANRVAIAATVAAPNWIPLLSSDEDMEMRSLKAWYGDGGGNSQVWFHSSCLADDRRSFDGDEAKELVKGLQKVFRQQTKVKPRERQLKVEEEDAEGEEPKEDTRRRSTRRLP